MVGLVIQLLIFCIFVFLVWYIINNVLPEPMRRIATVIAVVLVLLVLLVWLSQGGIPSIGVVRTR